MRTSHRVRKRRCHREPEISSGNARHCYIVDMTRDIALRSGECRELGSTSNMTAGKKKKDALTNRSKLPFVKNDGARTIVWWNVTPTGKWVEDFKVGRQYAMEFWKVSGPSRSFALEFQQIILGMLAAAKSPKGPQLLGYRGRFSPGGGRALGRRDPHSTAIAK